MSLILLFHYLLLNMFRMLVHPSSGACDLLWILFHVLYFSVRIEVLALASLFSGEGKLIPEQSPGETNPLFQTAINPQPPQPTRTDQ